MDKSVCTGGSISKSITKVLLILLILLILRFPGSACFFISASISEALILAPENPFVQASAGSFDCIPSASAMHAQPRRTPSPRVPAARSHRSPRGVAHACWSHASHAPAAPEGHQRVGPLHPSVASRPRLARLPSASAGQGVDCATGAQRPMYSRPVISRVRFAASD